VEFTEWDTDLANQEPMKNWQDFGDESVDDLDDDII
jgi:hypothetical protein